MTQILIDIQPSVMRIYQAEASQRGFATGQALIAALLADWPAILAPAHVDDVTPIIPAINTQRVVVFAPTEYSQDQEYAHDFPFGGTF